MLSTRELVLIAISIVLLLVIVYVVYRGCACMREGFEGEEAANADIPALEMSREEVALFEDLKSEKYSAHGAQGAHGTQVCTNLCAGHNRCR